jgi:hypothetical protein
MCCCRFPRLVSYVRRQPPLARTQNISDDHPAVEFLNDLETTAYYVDENSSGYILVRRIIHPILRWANLLNCRLKVRCSLCNFFLTQLPRVRPGLSLFATFDGTSHVSFDKQKLSGNVMQRMSMKGCRLLIWVDSVAFNLNLSPSLRLRSTGLYFLVTC